MLSDRAGRLTIIAGRLFGQTVHLAKYKTIIIINDTKGTQLTVQRHMVASFRLPTHSREARSKFFYDPFLN